MDTNNVIRSLESQSSYVSKASFKSTVRAEFTEPVGSMSDAEKLEAFKKEIWKEIDAMPWNGSINYSIQITDSAFKRMMNDEDFKNRMMRVLKEEAHVGRSPIVSSLNRIDENGYSGISYNDYNVGSTTFGVHSKDKDSFYVKKAKKEEINEAWEQARVRRQEQREYREKKYNAELYLKKFFAHQDMMANLYNGTE